MEYPSSREWAAALATAAANVLRTWPETGDLSRYRLEVRDCPSHGPCCVQVVYATAIIEHVSWQKAEPVALAAKLLSRMLPRSEEGGADI